MVLPFHSPVVANLFHLLVILEETWNHLWRLLIHPLVHSLLFRRSVSSSLSLPFILASSSSFSLTLHKMLSHVSFFFHPYILSAPNYTLNAQSSENSYFSSPHVVILAEAFYFSVAHFHLLKCSLVKRTRATGWMQTVSCQPYHDTSCQCWQVLRDKGLSMKIEMNFGMRSSNKKLVLLSSSVKTQH